MPLTLSHPALVLPMRRLGLPMTALVLGSMVPDGPLFVGWVRGYELSHSLWGVVTVDVVSTLGLVALWTFVMRDALVDLAPDVVRARFAPQARFSATEWAAAPVAAVIGSATHLFWDSFTHVDRWGFDHVAWLRDEHGGLAGYRWAQYVSGVVGLVIVLAAALTHLRSQSSTRSRPRAALSASWLAAAVALPLAAGLVVAVAQVPSGLHAMAFDGVVTCLLVGSLTTAGVCCAWQVALRRGRVPRGHQA